MPRRNIGKTRRKRGKSSARRSFYVVANEKDEVDLLALDKVLNELAEIDEQQAKVVELRYFSGLSIAETAEVLGISSATVLRDWHMAKAWLKSQIE